MAKIKIEKIKGAWCAYENGSLIAMCGTEKELRQHERVRGKKTKMKPTPEKPGPYAGNTAHYDLRRNFGSDSLKGICK